MEHESGLKGVNVLAIGEAEEVVDYEVECLRKSMNVNCIKIDLEPPELKQLREILKS